MLFTSLAVSFQQHSRVEKRGHHNTFWSWYYFVRIYNIVNTKYFLFFTYRRATFCNCLPRTCTPFSFFPCHHPLPCFGCRKPPWIGPACPCRCCRPCPALGCPPRSHGRLKNMDHLLSGVDRIVPFLKITTRLNHVISDTWQFDHF